MSPWSEGLMLLITRPNRRTSYRKQTFQKRPTFGLTCEEKVEHFKCHTLQSLLKSEVLCTRQTSNQVTHWQRSHTDKLPIFI